MSFEPRVPLTLAEEAVDFASINDHILRRRTLVEAGAQKVARRLAFLAQEFPGLAMIAVTEELTRTLAASLAATARFGHDHARRELRQLRRQRTVKTAYVIDDAGAYSQAAALGLDGVRQLTERRAEEAARKITEAVNEAGSRPGLDKTERALLLAEAARRATHNVVLELVGETLNMGRAAGVLTLRNIPEFAMRSEQMDKTTCDACSTAHGEIYEVGSSDYFANLPPSLCYGAGRCRGLMIHGDTRADVGLRPAA